MTLLEGDLKTYLQPNPEERLSFEKGISAAQTIQFLRDLTEGVVEQHTLRGKTHGDIKPANILRTRFAEDSGLIRLMLADCGNASYLESPTTDPRDNLGDVAFRAKELFKTESHPTIESDFYSAGAAMYQIVTGRLPLENILNQSKSPEEFIRSTSSSELRGYLRAEISEHCPRHFRNLFYVLLDQDREFRPKSDKEFQRLVEKAISRHKKSQLLSRLKRWGAIALTSLALLGAGVWQYDNYQARQNLIRQVQKEQVKRSIAHKIGTIKLLGSGSSGFDTESALGIQIIRAWERKFQDRETAYAAYLNPQAVYDAISDLGIKTNAPVKYKLIERYLEKHDEETYFAMYETLGLMDSFVRYDPTRYADKSIRNQWGEAATNYANRKALEVQKKKNTSEFDERGRRTGYFSTTNVNN